MKLKIIIGVIFVLAATFRLLVLCRIIPIEPLFSSQWENVYEPYFAAGIILFVGAYICYDGIKNLKK